MTVKAGNKTADSSKVNSIDAKIAEAKARTAALAKQMESKRKEIDAIRKNMSTASNKTLA